MASKLRQITPTSESIWKEISLAKALELEQCGVQLFYRFQKWRKESGPCIVAPYFSSRSQVEFVNSCSGRENPALFYVQVQQEEDL
jgi:hypothetical protein